VSTKAGQSHGEITSGLIAGVRQIIGDPAIRLVSLMEATLYTSVGTLQAYLPLYALTRISPLPRSD